MSSIRISQLNDFTTVSSDDFVPLVDSASLTTYRVTVTSFGGWFSESGSVLSASWASGSDVAISSSWAGTSVSSSTTSNLMYPNTSTASYGVNSLSASWSDRSGLAMIALTTTGTASYANFAKSASFAVGSQHSNTASYVDFSLLPLPPASTAISASYANFSTSGSYAQTASWAGQAVTALTASFLAGTTTSTGSANKYFNNVGCSWLVANPGGAFAVGNDLYVHNYSRHTSRRNLVKIDMRTNIATYKQQWSVDWWEFYGRAFRRPQDSTQRMLCFNNDNLWEYNITADTQTRFVGSGGRYHDLPVLVLNWSDATHPDVLCLYGSYLAGTYGNSPDLRWYRNYWNGAAWVRSVAPVTVNLDQCINNTEYRKFINYSTNPTAIADTLCWDFNPIKQRYYLIDTTSGYMHIFSHTTGNITSSWASTSITYEKSIAVPLSNTEPWANADAEKVTVDYDMDTGQERGIITNRRGNTSLSGCVTYINWPENGNW